MKTTVYLVRHGESEGNYTKHFCGWSQVGLTARGLAQAERTAEYLAQFPIDAVFSSDLRRAVDTARQIAGRQGLPVRTDARFRELNLGAWEGKTAEECRAAYPAEFDAWTACFYKSRCPGGESFAELSQRVCAGLTDLVAQNEGKSFCLVMHRIAMRAMKPLYLGIPFEALPSEPFEGNASVTSLTVENGRYTLLCKGYAAHLGALATFTSGRF